MTTTRTMKWLRTELDKADYKIKIYLELYHDGGPDTYRDILWEQYLFFTSRRKWLLSQILPLQLKEFDR